MIEMIVNDDWTQIIVDNLHALLGYNVNVITMQEGKVYMGQLQNIGLVAYNYVVIGGNDTLTFEAEHVVSMQYNIVKNGLQVVISLDS